jgi:UDP-N-acetylmuramoylalanine--D-glutamate ligase
MDGVSNLPPASTPSASSSMLGLSVLVLGLGTSGMAMAAWCLRRGAAVTVWDSRLGSADSRTVDAHAARLAELPLADGQPAVSVRGGALSAADLAQHRWVLRSPGLAPHDERIAALVHAAAETGVPVWGELQLFSRELARLRDRLAYAPQVLAVTGTNGKTTTTALTGLLVERTGRRVAVAGNIGPSLLDTLQAGLDQGADAAGDAASGSVDATLDVSRLPEVWVLELSSFQLHGVEGFDPSAAVVLNLTQDHLDWHGSMASYGAAKARIWGRSTASVVVVNRDDPAVVELARSWLQPPTAAPATGRAKAAKPVVIDRPVVRFGTDRTGASGGFGPVVENGRGWLVRALDDEEPQRRRRGSVVEPAEPLHLQRLMPADALRIRGRHNAANALAALALATAIGCPLAPMLHGLREYEGEPHRVQFIASIEGVDAFDDSKGTNVGATVAALDGLGRDREPARIAVILGGDGKGQDFSPLAPALARHARAVATIGRDAAVIEDAVRADCEAADIPIERQPSLEAAVTWCFAQARSGDAVLLSPACASLDMFRNYGHRAEVFVAAVQARLADQGGLA